MQTPRDIDHLRALLHELDGRGYRDYKRAKGRYATPDLELAIDHVQGDPFARPSRLRIFASPATANLPAWCLADPTRLRGTADFLHRMVYASLSSVPRGSGSGRSGELDILQPRQQVLERSAVLLDPAGALELRLGAGLPADGRRILGAEAAMLLCDRLPDAARAALAQVHGDLDALRRHVETVEDAVALRARLAEQRLVGFLADGSLLPRRSGVSDLPLDRERARLLRAPESLAVTLEAPNAGTLRGLGIPEGVTLLAGGGYHGKSTLLHALERGVYDHVPEDGRERVVAVASAVKVRAEDGRSVAGTDISNFIQDLPGGEASDRFLSENASGSTSQAASIVEALEAGAACLMLDEDTSAANFMIRDARMQRLVRADDEPITPFIDRARALYEQMGVSTVVVVGGSGDYFDVADTVIAMKAYQPEDATAAARRVAEELPTARRIEGGDWRPPARRAPLAESLDPHNARGRLEVRLRSGHRVLFGREEVDLSALEQVVEAGQLEAMSWALIRARDRRMAPDLDMPALLDAVMAEIDEAGIGIVHPDPIGDFTAFRRFELAAFLNRVRGLRTVQPEGTRVAPVRVPTDH